MQSLKAGSCQLRNAPQVRYVSILRVFSIFSVLFCSVGSICEANKNLDKIPVIKVCTSYADFANLILKHLYTFRASWFERYWMNSDAPLWLKCIIHCLPVWNSPSGGEDWYLGHHQRVCEHNSALQVLWKATLSFSCTQFDRERGREREREWVARKSAPTWPEAFIEWWSGRQ